MRIHSKTIYIAKRRGKPNPLLSNMNMQIFKAAISESEFSIHFSKLRVKSSRQKTSWSYLQNHNHHVSHIFEMASFNKCKINNFFF